MKKIKVFLLNGLLLTIASFIIRTVDISFTMYLSNKISAEGIGLFQLILSVYMFATTLATSGINLAATRLVSEELALNKESGARTAITKCIVYSLVLGLIASSLVLIFSNYIVTDLLHGKIGINVVYVIAISLPLMSMSSAVNGYFVAVRRVIKSASSQIFEQFVKIIITTFLLSLCMPIGINYACLCLVLGICISEFFSFIYVYILYIIDKKRYNTYPAEKENYTKRIFRISFPIAITSYVRSGLSTLKQLIIPIRLEKSGISCEAALAQYGMVGGMVFPILMFPQVIIASFSELLIPEFADLNYRDRGGSYTRINSILNRIFKLSTIFSIFIVGLLYNFAEELAIMCYNRKELVIFIKVLAPLVLLMYLDRVIDNILRGIDKQVSVMCCNILDLFVSIFLLYILLPTMRY